MIRLWPGIVHSALWGFLGMEHLKTRRCSGTKGLITTYLTQSSFGGGTPPTKGSHLGWSLSLFASENRKGPKGNNITVKKTILEGVSK